MKHLAWTGTGKKLHPKDVFAFESQFEWPLPEDYKNMLLEFNGGRPSRRVVEIPGKLSTVIKEFFGIGPHSALNLADAPKRMLVELPRNFLQIGIDVGGNSIALSLEPPQHVFWKDHEISQPNVGLIQIADSFSNLLQILQEESPVPQDSIEILAEHGGHEDLEIYLANGGSLWQLSSGGRTLAQEAARYGNIEMLKICAAREVSLEGTLHLAAMCGHMGVVRFLIEECQVNANQLDKSGRTAKTCAFIYPEIRNYLTLKGA